MTTFRVIPLCNGYNAVSYDNLESAKKRILALRKAGYHMVRFIREVKHNEEVYNIKMYDGDYYDYWQTSGYQCVDMLDFSIDDETIWIIYHGNNVGRDNRVKI